MIKEIVKDTDFLSKKCKPVSKKDNIADVIQDLRDTAYKKKHNQQAAGMNTETQYYKGIPIRLIIRNYSGYHAKRYILNGTNQNVWIPNKFLRADGTLMNGRNIDFVFKRARNQCRIAGLSGIKWLGI